MLTAAVIGCGPAGMATAARLRQKGMMVTCFEVAPEVGGMWNGNGHDAFSSRGILSPLYASLRCVLPKDLMSFSDIRMDFTAPQFPHHSFVKRYLHKYGDAKGLRAITRFNTKVESVRFDERDGRWKLISVNIASGDIHEWVFDRVAVCSGQHHVARFPEKAKEQLADFVAAGGEVTHSAYLKQFRPWKGKRALVVGDGVGAYDCMREMQRNGVKVTHSTSLEREVDPNDSEERLKRVSHLQQQPPSESTVAEGLGGLTGLRAAQTRSWEPVTLLTRLLTRLGIRGGEHHAHEVVAKWLRYQSEEILKVPRVGRIIGCSGRNVLCAEDPTRKMSRSEVVEEAVRRGSAVKMREAPSGSVGDADRKESSSDSKSQEDSDDQFSSEPEIPATMAAKDLVMLEEFDLVVFATGYDTQFPFLHDDIRRVVEGRAPPLRITEPAEQVNGDPKQEGDAADKHRTAPLHTRGLYLGTMLASNPTIAFIATQRDLLPPFLLMEAQASFIANAFTHRLQLPASEQGMLAYEQELIQKQPELLSLYSERGMGLHSAAYFNVLHQEMGPLEGNQTFSGHLARRQVWMFLNVVLMTIHKFRSWAPLKRKKQHLLFSNKI